MQCDLLWQCMIVVLPVVRCLTCGWFDCYAVCV
jgi:hypothetical protein